MQESPLLGLGIALDWCHFWQVVARAAEVAVTEEHLVIAAIGLRSGEGCQAAVLMADSLANWAGRLVARVADFPGELACWGRPRYSIPALPLVVKENCFGSRMRIANQKETTPALDEPNHHPPSPRNL
jgi:hypothetical protein